LFHFKKITIFRILIVPFLAVANLWAADTDSPLILSMSDALQLAQKRQVDVVVAQERVQQAIARVGQSRSSYLPHLTGGISQSRQTRDLRSSGISLGSDPVLGPFNAFDARIKLTQTIFDVAAIQRLKAAGEERQLSEAEYDKIKQDVMALVATLFIEAQRAAQREKVFLSLVSRDEKKLRLAYSRLKLGIGSNLEIKQAKADYARSLHDRQFAHSQSIERRLDLAAALGIPSDRPIVFKAEEIAWEEKFISKNERVKALNLHPELRVAQELVHQKKSERLMESAEYLPKISALADYGNSGIEPDDASETYMLGVQATMPIFEGGLRSARIEEAESRLKESEANLQNVGRQLEALALSADESIREAKALLKNKASELSASLEELNLVRQKFQTGWASEIELLEIKAMARLSQDQKQEAEAAYLTAQVSLAHALGKMEQIMDDKDRSYR